MAPDQSRGLVGRILLASAILMGVAGAVLAGGLVTWPFFGRDVHRILGIALLVAAAADGFLAMRFLGEPQR
jgi:hypothetical protein